jgi:uncharacterized protein DUF5336
MTNDPGQYSPYWGYPPQAAATSSSSDEDGRNRPLWLAVAALGLVTLGTSFGSPVALGWPVRFSVIAAAVAAVGLAPRQRSRGWLVVVAAVAGFADAVSGWVAAESAGWALVTVVAVNALQALVAIAAILVGSGGADSSGDEDGDYAAYAAYASYAQAYQRAYPTQQPYRYEQAEATGLASAPGHGATAARGRQAAGTRGDAAQDAYESLRDRYAEYGGSPGVPSAAPVHRVENDSGNPGFVSGAPSTEGRGQGDERSHERSPGAGW